MINCLFRGVQHVFRAEQQLMLRCLAVGTQQHLTPARTTHAALWSTVMIQPQTFTSSSGALISGSSESSRAADGTPHKAIPTPHSQAIALMISKDQMPREQLVNSMDRLSQQLQVNISAYSSTELSAFMEACRQLNYVHAAAFLAALQHLAPNAAALQADELPSLMWACARLAEANSSSSSGDGSSSSSSSGSSSSSAQHLNTNTSSGSSAGSGRTVPVPQNDGVCGSVSSSRIEGMPGVVEFVLGAAQVLTGDVEEVASEELAVLAAALADMEYRDPFLLTALAEEAMQRKAELHEAELVGLVTSFAAMGRWFFDNRLLDQLTADLVNRAQQEKVSQAAVDSVAAALAAINHNNKVLQQYLQQRSS